MPTHQTQRARQLQLQLQILIQGACQEPGERINEFTWRGRLLWSNEQRHRRRISRKEEDDFRLAIDHTIGRFLPLVSADLYRLTFLTLR